MCQIQEYNCYASQSISLKYSSSFIFTLIPVSYTHLGEVGLLERLNLGQSSLALLNGTGADHLTDSLDAVLSEEHVLGTAQALSLIHISAITEWTAFDDDVYNAFVPYYPMLTTDTADVYKVSVHKVCLLYTS